MLTIPDRSPTHSRGRRGRAALLALLFVLGGSRAADPDDGLALQRSAFQRAYAAIPDNSGSDSARLRSYVLYPYLEAARLAQALGAAGANMPAVLEDQISSFLRTHEAEPVAQELRRNWLGSLATRSKWSQFLALHRDASDGATLRCQGFTARIESQRTDGLTAEIAQTWLTPRSLPECERAFEWLRSTGGLTDALIEQRVRLSLEGGNTTFARQIARGLPAEMAAPALQWIALLENPRREIDALIAKPQTSVETPALLAGWTKLARAEHAAAEQRLDILLRARKLDARSASPFALALALPLSWDRDPQALQYFARVDAADFDDYAREWQTRAALWAGDWKQVSASIAAMSNAGRGTARWRYWAARAIEQQGDDSRARQQYESLLREDNYYSGMAAARSGQRIAPNLQSLPTDAAQIALIERLPAFVRARELRLAGLASNAQAEWLFGQAALQPSARAQSIRLAARWGWYDQAVATATSERVFNDYALLYPRPYDTAVAAGSRVSGLQREVIYGVIRQESLFRSDAVSSADARGLMQLLPETARRTARQWKQPAPSNAALFEPSVNVVLGAAHLKELLDRFSGQLPMALAGYNAGPNAVRRWMPAAAMDPDIWIENIPYNETRNYVQRILWHMLVFAWLEDSQPQDTKGWMKALQPAGPASK